MFFLRLTLYTCGLYLAVSLPIILAELAIERWMGLFGIHFHGRLGIFTFAGFWAVVWLVSFSLAFRAVFPNLWIKMLG